MFLAQRNPDYKIRFGLAVLCVAVSLSPTRLRAQQWNVAPFAADARSVYSAASAVSVAPGNDVLVLDEEDSYVFDAKGEATHTRYIVYKILTQQGIDGWDNFALLWEPWHQDQPTIRARVIDADGAVHRLDPKAISNSPATDDEDSVYGDDRVLHAPLPAVSAGSVIEEEDTSHDRPTIPGAGSVRRVYFGRGVPVEHRRLILQAPASIPLRYEAELLPDLKPQRSEIGGEVRITLDDGPEEPLGDPEKNLPSEIAPSPQVAVSTGDSWQNLADKYETIVNSQIANSNVQGLVDKLIVGRQSRDDKLQSILQYLDKEIRYTGVEFGDATVIPQTPTEVLAHKYGDCKDKAVLLVAMLRAAGIPAFVALLDAGERQDVLPDLPGMGLFDHAIVYVPGPPDLWVDATDRYARLRELPSSDQGRQALIIRPHQTALLRTPSTSAQDNILVEKREFHLAEYGPASVTEISQPRGDLESIYRDDYGDTQNKDVRENLTGYVKGTYLADEIDRIDSTDPSDLSKPFELTLTSAKAKRGFTDLNSAVAAIRLEGLFGRLPSDLQDRGAEESADSGSTGGKGQKKRTADYQLQEPFITEWQYKIIPPEGFRPKPLPKDIKAAVGPALLTETFSADKDGIVHATIRFDTRKSRFSTVEATEMRNAIADLKGGEAVLIYFEPIAEALLSQGNVREAFQTYRDLISLHPTQAVYHLRKAEALLSSGLGNAARQEAGRAVALEPNSALAEMTLADILEYDLVGRKFRPGSDYAGADAAFRKAEKLDPKDKTITGNLAVLLEFNKYGLRYGPGAKLDDAIAEYRRISAQDLTDMGLKNNLAFALFYDGKFAEALESAETINPQPSSLIVACEAALSGSQAGLAEAKKRTENEAQFREIVKNAGQMVVKLGKYSLAADLLEAGATGENASDLLAAAEIDRNTLPHENFKFPDNPAGVAMHFYLLRANPNLVLEQLRSILSRNGNIALGTPEVVAQYVKNQLGLISQDARSGIFINVGLDTSLTRAQPISQGNDATGYKVTLWPSESYRTPTYIVKEGMQYKALGTFEQVNGVGLEVLDRVAAKDFNGARVLLDWVRDDWHLTGSDDPLSGAAFPRLWTKGQEGDTLSMKLAAASILVAYKQTAAQGIAVLEANRDSTRNEAEKTNILLALLAGYNNLGEYDKALDVCTELAKQFPASIRVFSNQSFDLTALGRFTEADALAQGRLKRIPDDLDAQRALVFNAIIQGDHARAHDLGVRILNSGKAESSDFNLTAWQSLFTGKTETEDLTYATKAAQLGKNNFPALHTLGCVYAELGKTREALEVLIQAMDGANIDEPNSDLWYAFGRIAEQFGERDIAIEDYNQVEKPKDAIEIPQSSYELAQNRLTAMRATAVKQQHRSPNDHP